MSVCSSPGRFPGGRSAAGWAASLLSTVAITACRPQTGPTLGQAGPPVEPLDVGVPPDAMPKLGPPIESQPVTWTCATKLCPWGASLTSHAVVWPAAMRASDTRLGYTVSSGVYLAAGRANGSVIAIDTGTARAYAGLAGAAEHRLLATIQAGHTLHIDGLGPGEVLSVQSDTPFSCRTTQLPAATEPGDAPRRELIRSTRAFWRCNAPDCAGDDWTGAVIPWPEWAAYQSNGRPSGVQSRAVFSADGKPLYPYMGPWANGCRVTAESGTVEIIEWKRGTAAWRNTWLQPGESHTIRLVSPEDGAMIETYEGSPGFSVSLRNCTPQKI